MNVRKGRILCVDDEPHVLRALQWLLQKEFEVHVAGSAQDALRLVAGNDFDVIVSDQRMPGVTGVEFLREVRRRAPRAMRILLTGYSDLDAMVRSVNESEVFRFITKPWDIRELPKLISEAAEIARTEPVAQPEVDEQATAQTSRVVVLHPAASTQPSAPKHEVTTVALRGAETILLVDDNPEVHSAVTQVVGNTVQVQHAYNLVEAVRILNDKPVGVIVSEVRVGNIDATRLVRLMKARHPEIVSVVFSGHKDAETVMTLINQGQVYRFIPKPFKPGYISIVLGSALKRHRQLLESPGLRKRFAVEKTSHGAADSLLRDIRQASGPASRPGTSVLVAAPLMPIAGPALATHPAARASDPRVQALRPPAAPAAAASTPGDGLVSKLTSGFRRLFGT